jgi:hypothetical protein
MWLYPKYIKEVWITLDHADCEEAKRIGLLRNSEADKAGRRHVADFEGDGRDNHIVGAAGEMAFCYVSFRTWSKSVNTFKSKPDVDPDIDVRTRRRHDYDLLVRSGEVFTRKFVLVTGTLPTFCVRGWIQGRDARRDEWKKSYGGRPSAWFVPQSYLNIIGGLL